MRAMTCTCPDWREVRHVYRRLEPMRLCKHLVKEVVAAGRHWEYGSGAGRLDTMAAEGWGYFPRKEMPEAERDSDDTDEARRRNINASLGWELSREELSWLARVFGGEGYYYNFMTWFRLCGNQAGTVRLPRGDRMRWRFEVLTRTGVVREGAEDEFETSPITPDRLKRLAGY
ncbi:MAG: hypothetical protein KQJ78_23990 [Deltaproteobacteria bacterium]|nr:hypothetical protein [Deltaproteobacteria bacterium]